MAVVDVSFIILCWNSRQHLDGVLSSISRDLAATDLTYEVIVIDNGSRDDSLQRLRDWQIRLEEQSPVPARLFIVPLGSNTGTTFSRNIGLRMARGKYICILDSDITFNQPDTLTRLIAILDKYPQAGLVVPSLIYATGRHQKSCDVFPTITHKIKRRFFLRQIEQRESDKKQHGGQLASDPSLVLVEDSGRIDPQDAREEHYAISAFWLFRRSLVNSIGLLDERIFYAPEDVDYCLRAWLAGWWVLYVEQVQATHHAQEISRKKLVSRSSLSHLNGLIYFFRKHRFVFGLSGLVRRVRAAVKAWQPERM